MRLEDQVCSLELAKKLKELEVKLTTHLWDYRPDGKLYPNGYEFDYYTGEDAEEFSRRVAAFTVAELGEMLPKLIEMPNRSGVAWLKISKMINWRIYYQIGAAEPDFMQKAETEADARAKMLIYLIENNLIEKEFYT